MAKYERFSAPPRSIGIPPVKPRLTMVDRQIAALRAEKEREAMAIKTREELHDDLTNFSYLDPIDEYGLPIRTPYQVPDDVPDVLPLPQKDPAPQTSEEVTIPSTPPPVE